MGVNSSRSALAAVGLLFCTAVSAQQGDPLSRLDGIWVSVNPPGPHLNFYRVGLGQREVSLPMGQSIINVSDGVAGSNLKVSGEAFNCFYFVGFVNAREMTWELKKGDAICMPSAHYKKDPP